MAANDVQTSDCIVDIFKMIQQRQRAKFDRDNRLSSSIADDIASLVQQHFEIARFGHLIMTGTVDLNLMLSLALEGLSETQRDEASSLWSIDARLTTIAGRGVTHMKFEVSTQRVFDCHDPTAACLPASLPLHLVDKHITSRRCCHVFKHRNGIP